MKKLYFEKGFVLSQFNPCPFCCKFLINRKREKLKKFMAELTLVEEIQLLINLGVDPTVAATTVNNERTRRSPPAAQPGNYLIL